MGTERREPILDPPVVIAGGKVFSRWKNVSITTDIDSAAASFSLSVGPINAFDVDWEPLSPGSLVEVIVGGWPLLRGIVDSMTVKSSGTDETVDIAGRDVMGLLVDSSMEPGLSIKGKTLKEVAERIVQPFIVAGPKKVLPVLRFGSTGDAVKVAQQRLAELKIKGKNEKPYYDYDIDGIFKSITQKAVRNFQKDRQITIDGIIGPQTWGELDVGEPPEGEETDGTFSGEVHVMCFPTKIPSDEDLQKGASIADADDESLILKYTSADGTVDAPFVHKDRVVTEKYGKKPGGPEPNDKCEPYLRKLLDDKGVDMWVLADGTLVIGERAYVRTQEGAALALFNCKPGPKAQQNNFKDVQLTHSIQGRFSQYMCYGRCYKQPANTTVYKTALDDSVKPYKPSYEKVDKMDSEQDFDDRVRAQRDKALASRLELSGTAVGYGQVVDGEPHWYLVNRLVKVVVEKADINNDFYIAKATYSCDSSGGPQTSLTLRPVEPAKVGLALMKKPV